ncbi:MAG: lipoyl(octanoyl) transferase LipB [Gammaproteobacteria bacterium]|uniref:Octanoyltransferase n=1 Tax=Candidatus Thiopontia autotrophica TaxID=2841688 RepID=A0A8J6TWZ0_9GAMM|nr:lipoyl(octanoyl) transferase LipB [Candidatus Thiopontia autotrophica]
MQEITVRQHGISPYEPTWRMMQKFTEERNDITPDELWLVEHPPVFTLGKASKHEHLLNPGNIPVVQIDRGGQVTYHGPGQLVLYTMIDIQRKNIGVRALVTALENSLINTLKTFGIDSVARSDAPGVYVDGAKIAAIGLRIRKGRSFHGLSFNLDMDLEPFSRINPCGYRGLQVTQLSDLITLPESGEIERLLVQQLVNQLGYNWNGEIT